MICEGVSASLDEAFLRSFCRSFETLKTGVDNEEESFWHLHSAFLMCQGSDDCSPGFERVEWVTSLSSLPVEGLERSTRASDSAPAVGFMWALSYAANYAAFLPSFKRWLSDDQGVFSHAVESKTNKVELTHLQFPVDFMENEERITLHNYPLFFFFVRGFLFRFIEV